jgi:hypothetical protein
MAILYLIRMCFLYVSFCSSYVPGCVVYFVFDLFYTADFYTKKPKFFVF